MKDSTRMLWAPAEGMISRGWKACNKGCEAGEVAAMEHLLHKSAEAQLEQQGADVADTAMTKDDRVLFMVNMHT